MHSSPCQKPTVLHRLNTVGQLTDLFFIFMDVNGSHSTDERPKFLELWKIDIVISCIEQSELYGRMCRGKNTYSYALDKNIFWLHPRIPLLPVVQSNKWFIYSKIKVILSITQAIFEYHTSYKSKPRELFQASFPL